MSQTPGAGTCPNCGVPVTGKHCALCGEAAGAAPDISRMTPAERAQRLHDLVMRAYGDHAMDTVRRFSPMAISAYQMLDSMSL